MPRNQKLTKVIAGRIIKAVTVEPGSVLVLFDDESSIKIKTAGATPTVSPGSKVKSVQEAIQSSNRVPGGSIAAFCLADPGSSVTVQDKNNAVDHPG
jgi:hypothetical protein